MKQTTHIPRHVAIIMDGNGRWAKQHGKERFEGHIQGVESVRCAIKSAVEFGVEYLTIYAFSTENWGRPQAEVDALMELFCHSVVSETPELKSQGVKVRIIGDRGRFSEKVREHLCYIEQQTAQGEELTLLIALNYSSRDELRRAVTEIARGVAEGRTDVESIDEKMIADALDTKGVPDPDLLIRTSGECRLSNFLLWQLSYAELYFSEVMWPDFTRDEFRAALDEYARRERRFGVIK